MNFSTPILILGFGSIGKRHFQNITQLGYTNISVFDPNDELFTSEFSGSRLTDFNIYIASQFRVVIIATPNNTHVSLAQTCAEAGCDIFVEKPLSHNLENITQLIETCEKQNCITMVGCNMRFHPCLKKIKDLLSENFLGNVYAIDLEFGYALPLWRPQTDYRKNYAAKRETGGGILLDDIHEFDLLFWLNNFEKIEKYDIFYTYTKDLAIETESMARAIFQFSNNILGSVKCDYLQQKYTRNCKIIGQKGNLFWDFENNEVVFQQKDSQSTLFSLNFDFNMVYIDQFSYFFDCVKNRKKTCNSFQQAKTTLSPLISRIYEH